MEHIYFIGIGGIGMSALALYYNFKGKEVRGYDRTPSDITEMLSQKNMAITFSEDLDFIPLPSQKNISNLYISKHMATRSANVRKY